MHITVQKCPMIYLTIHRFCFIIVKLLYSLIISVSVEKPPGTKRNLSHNKGIIKLTRDHLSKFTEIFSLNHLIVKTKAGHRKYY